MNPDTNFNLPPPVPQAAPGAAVGQPAVPLASAPANDVSALQNTALQVTQQPAAAQPTAVDEATLDKEYVQSARKIAEQTRNDPFMQNQQLAQLRSDYLQKRYGKTVKLAD